MILINGGASFRVLRQYCRRASLPRVERAARELVRMRAHANVVPACLFRTRTAGGRVSLLGFLYILVAIMEGDGRRQSSKYRRVVLDRVLGKGAFSTVYMALVEPNDERIALKIVHLRDITDDAKTVRDCVNEISHLKVGSILSVEYYRITLGSARNGTTGRIFVFNLRRAGIISVIFY